MIFLTVKSSQVNLTVNLAKDIGKWFSHSYFLSPLASHSTLIFYSYSRASCTCFPKMSLNILPLILSPLIQSPVYALFFLPLSTLYSFHSSSLPIILLIFILFFLSKNCSFLFHACIIYGQIRNFFFLFPNWNFKDYDLVKNWNETKLEDLATLKYVILVSRLWIS